MTSRVLAQLSRLWCKLTTRQYVTAAVASGEGRNGHIELEDGSIKHDLKMPKELGGPGGGANVSRFLVDSSPLASG